MKYFFIRQIIYELFQVVMLRDLSCTLENRHGCVPFFFFFLLQTEQFTVLWLLFAMIVVGNIAVLIGLQWGKRRKTRMDFFIKQLAFAGKLFRFCFSRIIGERIRVDRVLKYGWQERGGNAYLLDSIEQNMIIIQNRSFEYLLEKMCRIKLNMTRNLMWIIFLMEGLDVKKYLKKNDERFD